MSEKNNNIPACTPEKSLLFSDLCDIISGARSKVATYLNTEICMTNWYVGKRIKEDVLYNQRAEYGKQVLKDIADRLTQRFGFTEDEMMYALRTQLTWTHLRSLIAVKV